MVTARILGTLLAATISATTSLAIGSVAPAGAAEDSLLTTVPRRTSIDAYRNRLVWSAWDADKQAYYLTEARGGPPHRVPIAPSSGPLDVDLGPDPRGGTTAVYSRCQRPLEPLPGGYDDGALFGCELYAYSFARKREFKVPYIRSRADIHGASLWGSQISYLHSGISEGSLPGSAIMRRPFLQRGEKRVIEKGPHGFPTDLDMRRGRVAFLVPGEFGGGQVRLSSVRKTRLLATIPGSGAAAVSFDVFGTSITRGFVYWMVTESGEETMPAQIRRVDLATR